MNIETFRRYCLQKNGAAEDMPFGDDVLVFKVRGKIFALLNLVELPTRVSLKCDPERAVMLRERYAAVEPGYHMNKTHWNTVHLDGSLPGDVVRGMIDHSYERVVQGLKKSERDALGNSD